ncbi:MAG: helix-turn-helix domain-containing protein [Pirellulales bacterium]|nr:helix-turn-helix domain-containing protein [Pirellulales bacterium]
MDGTDFEARRRQLGLSFATLAQRSGVSQPTLKRMLHGELTHHSFGNVIAVADALGMAAQFSTTAASEMREQQALSKARRLVGLAQGTSALEAQAVDQATFDGMVQQTMHELLAGSPRRLWA